MRSEEGRIGADSRVATTPIPFLSYSYLSFTFWLLKVSCMASPIVVPRLLDMAYGAPGYFGLEQIKTSLDVNDVGEDVDGSIAMISLTEDASVGFRSTYGCLGVWVKTGFLVSQPN